MGKTAVIQRLKNGRLVQCLVFLLEYQQNNFSLQFCSAYNLPIWLHITSADISQKSADVILKAYAAKLADCKQDKTAD